MSDHSAALAAGHLANEMGITEESVERRRRAVGLDPTDLPRIARIRDLVSRGADGYADMFFTFLSPLNEARDLMQNRQALAEARRLKVEHLIAMVSGRYGLDYARHRLALASLYNRCALDVRVFLGAFHHLLRGIGGTVLKEASSPEEGFEDYLALERVAFFDIALIVDAMVFERERTIRRQQEAIKELSTPVLQIRDRLLMLPIIGLIDTHRARMITEGLLHAIRSARAKVVVIDVTGVAAVDTKVANHLLQTVAAAKLMGSTVVVTGLSADVAQTLVNLGVDLGRLHTIGDLQGGIEEAERIIGYHVTKQDGHGSVVVDSPT